MLNLKSIADRWRRARAFNAQPVRAQILQRASGAAKPSGSGRCCIFAHYDPHGIIDPYVVYYLQKLRELDADIIFVTTSDSLRPEQIAKLAPLCRDIVRRVNISMDIGSYNLGIHLLGNELSAYRQLILANDSVYGPFHRLAPIFQQMETRGLDFWGLTESDEDGHHVQSYFLVFERSGIDSEFFRTFWGGFRQQWRKKKLIAKYEVGLSAQARLHAMRFASWLSSRQVGSGLNLTLFFWERLIEEFKFPFLKTEILKVNRFDSVNARRWREIVESASDYDCDLIAHHLRRVGSALAPPPA